MTLVLIYFLFVWSASEGGDGGPGGEGGYGCWRENHKYWKTGAAADELGMHGDDGDQGDKGLPGDVLQQAASGAHGKIITAASSVCSAENRVAFSFALVVARTKLLERSFDTGISLVEDILNMAKECWELDLPGSSAVWYQLYSEGVLLLNKFEKEKYYFGLNIISVPPLSSSWYKTATEELLSTEKVVREYMNDVAAGSKIMEGEQCRHNENMKAMNGAMLDLQKRFGEYRDATAQIDVEIDKNKALLKAYEGEVSSALQRLDTAAAQVSTPAKQSKFKKIKDGLTKAVGVCSQIASIASFGASGVGLLADFQSKIPGLLDNVKKLKNANPIAAAKSLFEMKDGSKFSLDDVLNLPRKLETNGKKALAHISNTEDKINSLIERAKELKNTNGASLQMVPISRSDLEKSYTEKLKELSHHGSDPKTQPAYLQVCESMAKVVEILRANGDLVVTREANINSMQNIAHEAAHIQNLIANLNSDQVVLTSDATRHVVNLMISRKMHSILQEEIFSCLETYARALSAETMTRVQFSGSFINSIKSYVSDKTSSATLLAAAMTNEVTTLSKVASAQKELDNMRPIEVKNVKWELPERAIDELLFSADHVTDVELPFYHPEFKQFSKRCSVKDISVKLINGKELNKLFRMRIIHKGNVHVVGDDGNSWVLQYSPRDRVKNVIGYPSSLQHETEISPDFGVSSGEYSAMIPFSGYRLQLLDITGRSDFGLDKDSFENPTISLHFGLTTLN